MTLCELKKLGFEFSIRTNGIYVEYETRFNTFDGWDSMLSEYGEYPDLETAIRLITADIAYDVAENNLKRFAQIAHDNYYTSEDWHTYLFLLRVFTQEKLSLKKLYK